MFMATKKATRLKRKNRRKRKRKEEKGFQGKIVPKKGNIKRKAGGIRSCGNGGKIRC